MSYPDPVYFGTGDVLARYRPAATPPDLPRPGGAASWEPGDFLYVPEGGLHGFRNESGEPATLLILFVPGAPREAYFEGLVELAEGRWKPSQEELQAFFVEHDNIYV